MSGQRQRWPKWVDVRTKLPEPRVEPLTLTFVGHATVLVQVAGLNILTDPVWSMRASPVAFAGPKRVHAPGVALDALPPIDLVLVSHNHYDHLDLATLGALDRVHAPQFVTPFGNDAIMGRAVERSRIIALDWDEGWSDGRLRVEAEPVAHWSARGRSDTNEALWAGFTVTVGTRRIFFAGDTGFADGAPFAAARRKHDSFAAALLPIGAYAPRWFMRDAHMDPEEAVAAWRLLGEPPALAIHHGTFQLTDEAREEPAERLRAAMDGDERFRAVAPGEDWQIDVRWARGTPRTADSSVLSQLIARLKPLIDGVFFR